jgi:Tol biopolymer transport system component
MSRQDAQLRSLSADRLSAAFNEVGGQARPDYLPDIVAQAGRTRQRPAWTFFERWLPMDIAVRRQGVPRAVLVFAVLALLITLLVATVAFIGARPSQPPLGAATNGLLAFASGGDIIVVEPDGTGRRSLVGGASQIGGMAYSPDGRRLAYWSRALAGAPWDLIIVDADGGSPVTVASGVSVAYDPSQPAWSPNGATIAYSASTPQFDGSVCQTAQNGSFCTNRIFLAAVDGSGARQVGDPALDARSPDWSPDGSTIAFGGGNASPAIGVHLYLMDADGSDVRQLSDVVGSDWAFVRVDWSRDGTKIVGQAGAADDITNWDIWVINADGSGATNVGAHPQGIDEIIPSWAPDRDALAWWADGIVLREEGADPVGLSGPDGVPMWSPDGQLLALNTDAGLVVMDLDGTVQTTIEGTAGDVAWQPLLD